MTNKERRLKKPRPVGSVAEEYIFLRRQRCACGGTFGLLSQELHEYQGRHYDILNVRCQKCGKERSYTFDISGFYGKAAG